MVDHTHSNSESLANLLKQNIATASSSQDKKLVPQKGSIKSKKASLTAEERLKKVRNDKAAKARGAGDFDDVKRFAFYTIFKSSYFVLISVVFAYGVIEFGNSLIAVFQDVLYSIVSGAIR